jgi:hypothetical protein
VLRGMANPVMHYTAMAAVTFELTSGTPDLTHAVPVEAIGVLGMGTASSGSPHPGQASSKGILGARWPSAKCVPLTQMRTRRQLTRRSTAHAFKELQRARISGKPLLLVLHQPSITDDLSQ